MNWPLTFSLTFCCIVSMCASAQIDNYLDCYHWGKVDNTNLLVLPFTETELTRDEVKAIAIGFIDECSKNITLDDSLLAYPNLISLEFMHCGLVELDSHLLDGLPKLESLMMISDIGEHALPTKGESNLEALALMGKNRSIGLPDGVFKLKNLRSFHLNISRWNRRRIIRDITDNMACWPKLECLYLYGVKKRQHRELKKRFPHIRISAYGRVY